MARRSRKKIKDLVDLLEDPESTAYAGGDYEDFIELMENEDDESSEDQEEE